jgi:uncharacterized protein
VNGQPGGRLLPVGWAARIPTDKQVRAFHERHAPSGDAFNLVYTHCEIVCKLVEQILARQRSAPEVDVELARAGALLHDIGVYRLYDASGTLDHANYVRHGVLGHELLRKQGFPDSLCRFCSCHTGVGLTASDVFRQGLPLPPGDYLAECVEEEIVMYADKFHSKASPPRFMTAASYAGNVRRFGRDKEERFARMVRRWGEPNLDALANEYGHALG